MRRLGLYPGSFDPPTLGHLDVIERATGLFDEIVVAVGRNSSKRPLLSADERMEALGAATFRFPTVRVESFEGLLVDYARSLGARSIVRGLRATADFEYELQMAMVNRRLAPEIESVYLMTNWEHSYLSSSMVREVAQLGGAYEELVPPGVADVMARALAGRGL
ncbi:pantetheine-phosphate adenylyltransferase [bacterium]|nr:MAG: pantetheine-phosphate adenylyltransferase [bacterium]